HPARPIRSAVAPAAILPLPAPHQEDAPMPLRHAFEALHFMVNTLASGHGSTHQWLREAWATHGAELEAEDLPADSREDLEFIHLAMAAGAEALTNEEASTLASAIAELREEVAFAFGRADAVQYPARRRRRNRA